MNDPWSQKLCAASGPAMIILLFVGIWPLAGFFPPPSPGLPAELCREIYKENLLGIRLFSILMMLAATLYGTFFGVVAVQVKRIEGGAGLWTYALLLSSALGSVMFFMGGVLFGVAAFRPDRPLESVALLNDLAWITLIIGAFPATMQAFAIGFATLRERSEKPIFPRWSGFANFWLGLVFLPGCFVAMFKSGPFAWDGLLAFWFPAIFFGLWIMMLAILVNTSVDKYRDSEVTHPQFCP